MWDYSIHIVQDELKPYLKIIQSLTKYVIITDNIVKQHNEKNIHAEWFAYSYQKFNLETNINKLKSLDDEIKSVLCFNFVNLPLLKDIIASGDNTKDLLFRKYLYDIINSLFIVLEEHRFIYSVICKERKDTPVYLEKLNAYVINLTELQEYVFNLLGYSFSAFEIGTKVDPNYPGVKFIEDIQSPPPWSYIFSEMANSLISIEKYSCKHKDFKKINHEFILSSNKSNYKYLPHLFNYNIRNELEPFAEAIPQLIKNRETIDNIVKRYNKKNIHAEWFTYSYQKFNNENNIARIDLLKSLGEEINSLLKFRSVNYPLLESALNTGENAGLKIFNNYIYDIINSMFIVLEEHRFIYSEICKEIKNERYLQQVHEYFVQKIEELKSITFSAFKFQLSAFGIGTQVNPDYTNAKFIKDIQSPPPWANLFIAREYSIISIIQYKCEHDVFGKIMAEYIISSKNEKHNLGKNKDELEVIMHNQVDKNSTTEITVNEIESNKFWINRFEKLIHK